MCSRYELTAEPKDIARHFGIPDVSPQMPPDMATDMATDWVRSEIRPTNAVLTIPLDGLATIRRWGPPAPWDGKPLINARAETVLEKPTFRPFLQGRCVLPATAYFEWRTAEDGKKWKNRITRKDRRVIAFAGLMNETHVTILTSAPADSIRHIHGRMPVIMYGRTLQDWLNPDQATGDLVRTLHPFDGPLVFEEETLPQPDLFA